MNLIHAIMKKIFQKVYYIIDKIHENVYNVYIR